MCAATAQLTPGGGGGGGGRRPDMLEIFSGKSGEVVLSEVVVIQLGQVEAAGQDAPAQRTATHTCRHQVSTRLNVVAVN